MSLVTFLMAKRGISQQRAELIAKRIIAKQAERAAAKKIKLAQSQGLLPFDGQADEEPTNRFEQDPNIPF